MKKMILFLLMLCCFVFANETPKIAVYVGGSEDAAVNEALSDLVLDALVKSGHYRSIDRPQDFTAKTIRADDGVLTDDSLILESGKTAGAQYLCFVKILAVLGSNQISARIVGVESDSVIELGIVRSPLGTVEDLHRVSVQITKRLPVGQNKKKTEETEKTEKTEETEAKQVSEAMGTVRKETQKDVKKESLFVDARDNKEYKIKRIGDYYWFMQDLDFNGKGKYNWNDACDVCPQGWRLPGNNEWGALKKTASLDDLKEFTEKNSGRWWSATEKGRKFASYWYFSRNKLKSSPGTDHVGKGNAYGVRCVK